MELTVSSDIVTIDGTVLSQVMQERIKNPGISLEKLAVRCKCSQEAIIAVLASEEYKKLRNTIYHQMEDGMERRLKTLLSSALYAAHERLNDEECESSFIASILKIALSVAPPDSKTVIDLNDLSQELKQASARKKIG